MAKQFGVIILCLFVYSCGSTESASDRTLVTAELPAEASLTEDSRISDLLNSYRNLLDQKMGVKIAELTAPAVFGKPEGALGNMAADALRFRASREARRFVHLGFIGSDSFRLNFNEGDLTLGDIYEFMPYENHLVLIRISGSDVMALSNQIAARNGEPVSGMRFRLQDGKARGVLVNSETVDSNKTYWLATSNYYANGGGGFTAITNPVERIDFEDVSIRQLYVDHFRNLRVVEPASDGRIQ